MKSFKYHVILLSAIFPLTFLVLGIVLGFSTFELAGGVVLGLVGLIVGLLADYVCYYRKLFTLLLFWFPIPILLMLVFLWISNPFVNNITALVFALFGLAIGLLINYVLVRPYQFYKLKKRILAVIYIFFSFALLGIFKGVPAFNLLLGVLAGNYLAIRAISNRRSLIETKRNFHQGALFSAVVMLFIALLAGWMAFIDQNNLVNILNVILDYPINAFQYKTLLITGGTVLILCQYFLTYITAIVMFKYRMRNRPSMDRLEI